MSCSLVLMPSCATTHRSVLYVHLLLFVKNVLYSFGWGFYFVCLLVGFLCIKPHSEAASLEVFRC